MTPDLLKRIIADQREEETLPADHVTRHLEDKISSFMNPKEIIVFKGVRRCGKSVLLQSIRKQNKESDYYFNFEDERLVTFTVSDFQLLQETFVELFGIQKTYYFDEIQNIEGWELFVRRLYNGGNKIYITGSNATLFSEELGTRLTGRYIAYSIYPFSFSEFLKKQNYSFHSMQAPSTVQIGQLKKLLNEYIELGGFPEYINNREKDYLNALYESIIYRDIIVRHKIANPKMLQELVFYLASHCSKEMTYNALKKLLGAGSATTISDYCSYLEDSYLCFFVNRYSESVKSQMQSPKKVYFIDHVLAKLIGFRFSDDRGRLLENIVFLELKRRAYEVYYHKENKECDFLVRRSGKIIHAIQVCQQLENANTKQREIEGLLEALSRYSLESGTILVENGEDVISIQRDNKNYKIFIVPIWKWLLSE